VYKFTQNPLTVNTLNKIILFGFLEAFLKTAFVTRTSDVFSRKASGSKTPQA
jgi:hypothetical protein